MEPAISSGSFVFASSLPYLFSKPKIGDIVVVQIQKKYIIKRISNIVEGKFYITGDNKNDSLDSRKIGWIERREIVGKVIKIEK